VSGFPCLWVTPFAFYGEKTATLLQALDRCLQSGQLGVSALFLKNHTLRNLLRGTSA
jgi:hypothetical protein